MGSYRRDPLNGIAELRPILNFDYFMVQGVHGKHRTVRRACLCEPLAAATLSRVSPEQELLLVPIDGAITLASYGAEFENVFFFIRDLSGVTFVLRGDAFDKIVLLSV